jgi:hypothetical protein
MLSRHTISPLADFARSHEEYLQGLDGTRETITGTIDEMLTPHSQFVENITQRTRGSMRAHVAAMTRKELKTVLKYFHFDYVRDADNAVLQGHLERKLDGLFGQARGFLEKNSSAFARMRRSTAQWFRRHPRKGKVAKYVGMVAKYAAWLLVVHLCWITMLTTAQTLHIHGPYVLKEMNLTEFKEMIVEWVIWLGERLRTHVVRADAPIFWHSFAFIPVVESHAIVTGDPDYIGPESLVMSTVCSIASYMFGSRIL